MKDAMANRKMTEVIDFIKHQINVDIRPFVYERFCDRKQFSVEWDKVGQLDKVNIIRLENQYKMWRMEKNGHSFQAFVYL